MGALNRRVELFLLIAITLLAAFLRLYQLDTLPPGDGHDVAQYGVDAMQILDGARPIFLESNFGREVLFSYLVALAYLFVGPGTFGIHLASAITGILTVPAIFLATRELFYDNREDVWAYLPLLAALLAAVSYWHLNWSRVGLRVILVPLLAALIAFELWRGFRKGHWAWFAITGVLLGLSLYSYQAARLLPVLVVLAFVLRGALRRLWTRADTIHLIITVGMAAIVFLPLGIYAQQHPGALSVRLRQALVVDATQPLGDQLGTLIVQGTTTLLTYSFRGDTDPQFTIAGRPSLNPFLSVAFFLGILVALWRFRRSPYLFLLVWLAIMTAPAMIADQAATAKRYLGAFPAVMILIAIGLVFPLAWLGGRRAAESKKGEADRRSTIAIMVGIVVGLGLIYTFARTWRDYFVIWAADPDLPTHFQVDYREIGAAIRDLDPHQSVWLSPYLPDQPVIQLHAGLRKDLRGYNGRFCVPYSDPVGEHGLAYIIVPGLQDASLTQLQQIFPEGETIDGPNRPGSERPYYRLFSIPPEATTGIEMLAPQAIWNEQIALVDHEVTSREAAPGETVTITLTYEVLTDITSDYTAFVHLLGPPNPESGSSLWAQSDSTPCGGGLPTYHWQSGDIIRDTIQLQLPAELPEGDYNLATGFYTWPDLARLKIGETSMDSINLGEVRVRHR